MPMKYRKKPVVIDAIPLTQEDYEYVQKFCGDNIQMDWRDDTLVGAYLQTLEGGAYATIGDYIIKGVDGEFYPCKPQVFEKTYVRVGASS